MIYLMSPTFQTPTHSVTEQPALLARTGCLWPEVLVHTDPPSCILHPPNRELPSVTEQELLAEWSLKGTTSAAQFTGGRYDWLAGVHLSTCTADHLNEAPRDCELFAGMPS